MYVRMHACMYVLMYDACGKVGDPILFQHPRKVRNIPTTLTKVQTPAAAEAVKSLAFVLNEFV